MARKFVTCTNPNLPGQTADLTEAALDRWGWDKGWRPIEDPTPEPEPAPHRFGAFDAFQAPTSPPATGIDPDLPEEG